MKRLKRILGVAVLFLAVVAMALVFAAQSQALAHVEQKTAPTTAPASHRTKKPANGTVIVGDSLNGNLRPPEEPWQNWLR